MTSSYTKNFSIDPTKHKKVLDTFDLWSKQGLNQSNEICKAIKYYQADIERGSKMDQYIEQNELMKMPRINQELKDEDVEMICGNISRVDFYNLCMVMEINLNKILNAKRSPATTYKKSMIPE
jgi:hypothetical protein